MEPVLADFSKAKTLAMLLCCLCCLTCGPAGLCCWFVIAMSYSDKKAAAVHNAVVEYCHDNRETFYNRGVRPRPGTCGCYVVFEAN